MPTSLLLDGTLNSIQDHWLIQTQRKKDISCAKAKERCWSIRACILIISCLKHFSSHWRCWKHGQYTRLQFGILRSACSKIGCMVVQLAGSWSMIHLTHTIARKMNRRWYCTMAKGPVYLEGYAVFSRLTLHSAAYGHSVLSWVARGADCPLCAVVEWSGRKS